MRDFFQRTPRMLAADVPGNLPGISSIAGRDFFQSVERGNLDAGLVEMKVIHNPVDVAVHLLRDWSEMFQPGILSLRGRHSRQVNSQTLKTLSLRARLHFDGHRRFELAQQGRQVAVVFRMVCLNTQRRAAQDRLAYPEPGELFTL